MFDQHVNGDSEDLPIVVMPAGYDDALIAFEICVNKLGVFADHALFNLFFRNSECFNAFKDYISEMPVEIPADLFMLLRAELSECRADISYYYFSSVFKYPVKKKVQEIRNQVKDFKRKQRQRQHNEIINNIIDDNHWIVLPPAACFFLDD
jgi:hypothetical protein